MGTCNSTEEEEKLKRFKKIKERNEFLSDINEFTTYNNKEYNPNSIYSHEICKSEVPSICPIEIVGRANILDRDNKREYIGLSLTLMNYATQEKIEKEERNNIYYPLLVPNTLLVNKNKKITSTINQTLKKNINKNIKDIKTISKSPNEEKKHLSANTKKSTINKGQTINQKKDKAKSPNKNIDTSENKNTTVNQNKNTNIKTIKNTTPNTNINTNISPNPIVNVLPIKNINSNETKEKKESKNLNRNKNNIMNPNKKNNIKSQNVKFDPKYFNIKVSLTQSEDNHEDSLCNYLKENLSRAGQCSLKSNLLPKKKGEENTKTNSYKSISKESSSNMATQYKTNYKIDLQKEFPRNSIRNTSRKKERIKKQKDPIDPLRRNLLPKKQDNFREQYDKFIGLNKEYTPKIMEHKKKYNSNWQSKIEYQFDKDSDTLDLNLDYEYEL